jgi:hypothetical protein
MPEAAQLSTGWTERGKDATLAMPLTVFVQRAGKFDTSPLFLRKLLDYDGKMA